MQHSSLNLFIPCANRTDLAYAQEECGSDKVIHENEPLKAEQHEMMKTVVKDAPEKNESIFQVPCNIK
jgi:hypothetical protein